MKYIASKCSLLLLLLLAAAAALAQTEPCKAKVRANRKMTIAPDKMQLMVQSWSSYYGDEFTRIPAIGYDTISVCRQGGYCTVFKAHGPTVVSSMITYWDRQGEEWTDSLNLDLMRPEHCSRVYFNTYKSNQAAMTLNKKRRSRLYYKAEGGDSLYQVQYEDGLTDTIKWYGRYGSDSLTEVFTRAQILAWRKTMHQTEEYEEGRLALVLFDTLVNEWNIKGRKEYYSNGVLRSVVYYKETEPVLIWSYYREDGSLVKRVRNASVTGSNPYSIASPEPPTDHTFYTVEQMPEYGGGYTVFQKDFNRLLQAAICNAAQPLKGIYRITLEISRDGRMTIQGIEGQHAAVLEEELKGLSGTLQRWKPGKRNGCPTDEKYSWKILLE